MSCETIITAVGLALDLVGVLILFFKTKTSDIGRELAAEVLEDFTQEVVEWNESHPFEEHQRGLSGLKRRVKRTHNWTRIGLELIIVGFSLQLIALFV